MVVHSIKTILAQRKATDCYAECNHRYGKKVIPDISQSFWIASTQKTNYPALNEDIKADVAVVGGGIAGITSAFLLKREGLRVVLIEADRIVQGTSGEFLGLSVSRLPVHLRGQYHRRSCFETFENEKSADIMQNHFLM